VSDDDFCYYRKATCAASECGRTGGSLRRLCACRALAGGETLAPTPVITTNLGATSSGVSSTAWNTQTFYYPEPDCLDGTVECRCLANEQCIDNNVECVGGLACVKQACVGQEGCEVWLYCHLYDISLTFSLTHYNSVTLMVDV
jgi:hypothetical protein